MTEQETRAGRHRGQPPPRLTPNSLYWYYTKAPRRMLTDPNQDIIRPALVILGVILAAFFAAVRDITTQYPWYVPVRGVGELLLGLLLVWMVIAYLGRPPTVSKPSLIARARKYRLRKRDPHRG
jgi:hypothetical protein